MLTEAPGNPKAGTAAQADTLTYRQIEMNTPQLCEHTAWPWPLQLTSWRHSTGAMQFILPHINIKFFHHRQ